MDEMDIEIRNNVMRVLVECRKEKGITQARGVLKYCILFVSWIISWINEIKNS